MNNSLNQIQNEILKALIQLGNKSTYSEFILAKKIRENAKIEGKKKAGIGLSDLEKVLSVIEETEQIYYSLHLNSANDILIEKSTISTPLSSDARKRRQSSEKSMEIFTNSDFTSKKNQSKGKQKQRSERKHINIYSNFEDLDD